MRFKTIARCTASLAVISMSVTAAYAQDAAPVQGGDTAEEDAIVVTGIRESLQSAQGIKRKSDKIVDTIVAEDIGKLPDIAVSETAARIPGVQVIRKGR